MAAEATTLELTRLSCRSLRPFNCFRKPILYATVSLVSATVDGVSDQQYQTQTDKLGGCNPNWAAASFSLNITRTFLEQEDVFVKFQFFCQGSVILPTREVGEVQVPLKDLMDDYEGVERIQQYRVRGHGKKASLHFSSKLRNVRGGGAGGRGTFFSYLGEQVPVKSLVLPEGREFRRCSSMMVAAEINGDDGSGKEEEVAGKKTLTGLQVTGYGGELDRWGGSLYGNRLL